MFLEDAYSWDVPTIYSRIAQYTSVATGADYEDVLNSLNNGEYDEATRVSWKYGAYKQLTGAPRFFINGVWAYGATYITDNTGWTNYFNGLTPN